MIIARALPELTKAVDAIKAKTQTLGFVPTMGALHDGHLSLVDMARRNADQVAVSIFVNPAQFAPHEDFGSYPREEDRDLEKLKKAGVDLVYLPSRDDIYGEGLDSAYKPGEAAIGLETDFRPHFFGGVVNVVSRLFKQLRPDCAVFGEKDYQQLQVIREMVANYDMGVTIIGAPIIRDKYGLALSSRNAYLSEQDLQTARQFNVILKQADPAQDNFENSVSEKLRAAGFDKVDYVASRWGRILGAAWLGKTRLIDNVPVFSPP